MAEIMQFKAESKRLLDLMINSIYIKFNNVYTLFQAIFQATFDMQ